jgi:hypothetical protein
MTERELRREEIYEVLSRLLADKADGPRDMDVAIDAIQELFYDPRRMRWQSMICPNSHCSMHPPAQGDMRDADFKTIQVLRTDWEEFQKMVP